MTLRKRIGAGSLRVTSATAVGVAAMLVVAACSSSSSSSGTTSSASSTGSASTTGTTTIGVALTYNSTAFWAAYLNYENQYAQQLHIHVLGPLLAGNDANLQNTQIEDLVNEGAKAIVVNPETATSLGPAISYAAAHHVQLISVDTIVGVGKVYMVVRASNILYGMDACAYISSQVKSGYVTNAFNDCMTANDPGVHILKAPTVWTEATAVTDAQNAVNAYGSQLKAIYSQWSSPDTGILPLLKSKGLTGKVLVVSDDGVPFEMCDITNGSLSASQSQPANLYAYWALKYALDAANGVKLTAGEPGGGAPTLQLVTYAGDTNLADPIVAPFVTKTAVTFNITPVDGQSGAVASTPVSNSALWGNVYGNAHGGVCSVAS